MEKKSPDAFRTISEVAEWLGVPTHVLRFWESRFSQVKPVKRAGGRRYYRPNDMELLGGIRKLLHQDGMTIRGVQKLLREEGVKHVAAMSPPLDSDEMRDITPSNVVPLAGKSAPEDQPDDSRHQDEIADTSAAEDAAAAKPQPELDQPDAASAQPAQTEDVASATQSEAEPHFTRSDVDTPSGTPASNERPQPADDPTEDPAPQQVFGSSRVAAEASSDNAKDTADEPSSATPELPGLHGASESSDVASAPAPLIDISHIPADPGDGDATPRPSLTNTLRRARQTGTGARIAALQALADRLESLAAQMGRDPGQTP